MESHHDTCGSKHARDSLDFFIDTRAQGALTPNTLLGLERSHLYKKMKALGIREGKKDEAK